MEIYTLCKLITLLTNQRLGDSFGLWRGYSIPRGDLTENGVYYLHYGDIHTKNKSYINTIEDANWLPRLETTKEKNGADLKTGDIVFADASEDYNGVGKSVVIYADNDEIVAGLHTIIAKDKEQSISIDFKRYFLGSCETRKQFKKLATGSKIYGISKGNIGLIKIALPTHPEQLVIGGNLAKLEAHIEKLDKTIEDYQLLKKGMMKKLLTEGIGHTEFIETEIGRIPKDWEVKRLDQVCDKIFIGLVTSMTKHYSDEGVLLIRNSVLLSSLYHSSKSGQMIQ